jgi:hypothetical protein
MLPGRLKNAGLMAPRLLIRTALLGAAALAATSVPGMHAQTPAPPAVQITNGAISATVYLPDARTGYYRGTRFDWAGVIGHLEYRGHTYYAPWFTKTDATVRDFVNDGIDVTAGPHTAVTGPAEEFSVLGFADAAPGGAFVKIGVGALRKPDDGSAYSAYRSYDFADAGTRTTAVRPDGVDFTHELADTGSGYGYHYTKNLRLTSGRPELVISHRLVNRGTKPIAGTVYNHNFLVLDGQTPGPDFVITAPFELTTAQPLDPAVATISGRQFRYAAPVPDRGRVAAQFQGFGPTAADYRFTIENRKVGAGVELTGDRPMSRLALWSIRTVLALEPFLALHIEPGAEYTWEYTYRYYTIP